MNDFVPIIIIGIISIVIIAALLLVVTRLRKKKMGELPSATETDLAIPPMKDLNVSFKSLPSTVKVDETKLAKIENKQLVRYIENNVPNAGKALADTKKAKDTAELGKGIYRAIIPKGANLDNSRAMKDAFRGTYRGAKGIKGQANLVSVDEKVKELATKDLANAGYDLASMVVGQHYMAEIDKKLESITEEVDKISKIQESEYKSRVLSLIAEIQTITEFQLEIMGNEETRKTKLNDLQSLRRECTQLLGQANEMIEQIISKTPSKYTEYEKILTEADSWYCYQTILTELLYKISEIEYILNLGQVSKEQCFSVCGKYMEQVFQTQSKLTECHENSEERFAIDIDNAKRKRMGIEGVVFKIPSLIKEEWGYRTISKDTAEMIDDQSSPKLIQDSVGNPFDNDVELIVKDGEIFYLPSGNEQ